MSSNNQGELMKKTYLLSLFLPLLLISCSNNDSDADANNENAQQIADSMASIDESGGASGEIALQQSNQRIFNRLAPQDIQEPFWKKIFVSDAIAASCLSASTFGSCDSNTVTHTFDDCTLLLATFSGTVTFTWGGTSTDCELQAVGDTITRKPDYSVTGLLGAELTVSQTGTIGQRLTWVSGTDDNKKFEFNNDGVRREFKKSDGTILLDFSTKTNEAISITGTKRSNREIDGGVLHVTNNKTDVTCNYTPSNVKWSSTCNCATSGSWSGDCSDGKHAELKITGCGTGDMTMGSDTFSVDFDRCIGI
jgi:hypothetical protein